MKIKLHLYSLEMTGRNTQADYGRAVYFDRYNNLYDIELGFLYYTKKEISRKLREELCNRLNRRSQYIIYS